MKKRDEIFANLMSKAKSKHIRKSVNSFLKSGSRIDTKEAETLIDKVARAYIKHTAMKSIRLKVGAHNSSDNEARCITRSKIGGTPYWPADMKWPEYKGEPMFMLAQINFDQIPNLEGYPSTGILQFFVYDDQYWENIGCKCVYHEKVITDNSKLLSADNIPRSSFSKDAVDIDGTMRLLSAEAQEQARPYDWTEEARDVLYEEVLVKFSTEEADKFDALMNDTSKGKYALNDYEKRFISAVNKNRWGSRLGGYASFTQYDPREGSNTIGDYILLFQIDTENGIMFGDCGIVNMFISPSDLKAKKFDKVVFHGDCC